MWESVQALKSMLSSLWSYKELKRNNVEGPPAHVDMEKCMYVIINIFVQCVL